MTARRLAPLLAVFATLALAACYPTAREPIGTSNGVATDPELSGIWRGSIGNDEGAVYLFFISQKPLPPKAMLVYPGDTKNTGGWATFSIVLGKVGTHRILNALLIDGSLPRDDNPDFTPLLYRIDVDGTLTFFLLDKLATEDAVRANRLAGDIVQTPADAAVTLTGDVPTLDKFFAANAEKFFTQKFGTFHRVE